MVNTMLKAAHKNVVDQICMAILINFLSHNLWVKGHGKEAHHYEILHQRSS